MKACDERARQRDEDGTGNPCAVGEAVARASVSAWCLPPAVVQPPAQGRQAAGRAAQGCWPVVVKGSTEMSLVIVCGTWWVWHQLKQMFLVPVSVG